MAAPRDRGYARCLVRGSSFLILSLALLDAAACVADAGGTGFDSMTTVSTTTDPSTTTGMMTTTMDPDSSTTDPSPESTGDPGCDGELIDAPDAPMGWEGPVVAYGFEGSIGTGPDCGEGTPAPSIGVVNPETTTCACECDAPPENLCGVNMFGDCAGGAGLGAYGGGCFPFDETVLQFQANTIPLGSCLATASPSTPPLTPSFWGCEIPDDGCSLAPDGGRVCVYAQGMAAECPTGFENGPVMASTVTCDGPCDNCTTTEYCATAIELELHSTADCSMLAAQTVGPLECGGGSFEAIRAVPVALSCPPAVELTRTPLAVSVCCVP